MNPSRRAIGIGLLLWGYVTLAFCRVPVPGTETALSSPPSFPFYVYREFQSKDNHFAPTGWMGDISALRFVNPWQTGTPQKRQVIQIAYQANPNAPNGWAGIYWQNPPNNWGHSPGGFNLNGARRLVFQARGEKGGETIAEFKVGGISGDYSDSATATLGPVTLGKEWASYTIPLEGLELSSISGGFCFTITRDDNPKGAVFFLDDIRFE